MNELSREKAQRQVNLAVKAGRLLPIKSRKCHGCDKQAHFYHHQSYRPENSLCVVPLCASCHRLIHTERKVLNFGVVPTHVGLVRIAIAG